MTKCERSQKKNQQTDLNNNNHRKNMEDNVFPCKNKYSCRLLGHLVFGRSCLIGYQIYHSVSSYFFIV